MLDVKANSNPLASRVLDASTPNYSRADAIAQFMKREGALTFHPDVNYYTSILEERDDILYRWYPMRISYSQRERAIGIRDELLDRGFETYLHLQEPARNAFGEVKEGHLEGPIYNIVFVRAMKIQLKLLKRFNAVCCKMQFMPYRPLDVTQGTQILWIPDAQMNSFRDAATRPDPCEQRKVLTWSELLERPHRKVRIITGPFEGVEGELVRIKGNRIVVSLLSQAKVAVGIMYQPPENLELLDS